jgi:hypothetical protein
MVEMATWTDAMDEYVGKLLAHLARHTEQFRKHEAVRYSPSVFRLTALPPPSGLGVNVVNVDPAVAGGWSERFTELMRCIERKDTAQVRKLLSNTEFRGGAERLRDESAS